MQRLVGTTSNYCRYKEIVEGPTKLTTIVSDALKAHVALTLITNVREHRAGTCINHSATRSNLNFRVSGVSIRHGSPIQASLCHRARFRTNSLTLHLLATPPPEPRLRHSVRAAADNRHHCPRHCWRRYRVCSFAYGSSDSGYREAWCNFDLALLWWYARKRRCSRLRQSRSGCGGQDDLRSGSDLHLNRLTARGRWQRSHYGIRRETTALRSCRCTLVFLCLLKLWKSCRRLLCFATFGANRGLGRTKFDQSRWYQDVCVPRRIASFNRRRCRFSPHSQLNGLQESVSACQLGHRGLQRPLRLHSSCQWPSSSLWGPEHDFGGDRTGLDHQGYWDLTQSAVGGARRTEQYHLRAGKMLWSDVTNVKSMYVVHEEWICRFFPQNVPRKLSTLAKPTQPARITLNVWC